MASCIECKQARSRKAGDIWVNFCLLYGWEINKHDKICLDFGIKESESD
jgi:hypothetical protein